MRIPYVAGVYCLKALNSKLIYIGSSKSLGIRRNVHKSQLKNQDKKRGCSRMIEAHLAGDQIEFEVVEICENFLEREQYWLDFYRKQDVYNIINRFDADRNGSQVSDEFRDKMSSAMKKNWENPEYRKLKIEQNRPTMFKKSVKNVDVLPDEIAKELSVQNRS